MNLYSQKLELFYRDLERGKKALSRDPHQALLAFRSAQKLFPAAEGFKPWWDYFVQLIAHREEFYRQLALGASGKTDRGPSPQPVKNRVRGGEAMAGSLSLQRDVPAPQTRKSASSSSVTRTTGGDQPARRAPVALAPSYTTIWEQIKAAAALTAAPTAPTQ